MTFLLNLPGLLLSLLLPSLNQAFHGLTQPARYSIVLGTAVDLTRSRAQLIAENALLRKQQIVLHRQVKKPHLTPANRLWFLLLPSPLPNGRRVLLIFQPDTLLRWHRQGFSLFWKFKSRNRGGRPQLTPELIALVQRLATENRMWGAEHIRGELLKLGFHAAKGTIQKYLVPIRPYRFPSPNWSTFLKNHAHAVRACDFLPFIDLLFRPLFLFFIVELASRRVVHFGVTRSLTDAWVTQQLHEDTPFGEAPRFPQLRTFRLIGDLDRKYGEAFTRIAKRSSIEILKTPYRAPGPMQFVNISWGASGENVWITYWCGGSGTCIV